MARDSAPLSSRPLSALWLLGLLLFVILVMAWRYWLPGRFDPAVGDDPTAKARPAAPAVPATTDETRRIEIFRDAKVSVVNVTSAKVQRAGFLLQSQAVPKGSGTGFLWDSKGRVVTNYHVVEDADQIRVTLDDHTTWVVHQVRFDPANDLAVLWTDIPAAKCKPIPVGESDKLQVGQSVLAIGNPFGLDQSLSAGIISALGRDLRSEQGRTIRGLVQTDAAINPGNSGGPLLDSSGRLIGVNTAIISPSGSSAGVGFAIPVDTVNRVVPRLISGAKEARPSLGIIEAPDQWARQRGIEGVLVIDVLPDGPAARAKLQPTYRDEAGRIVWGDVIVGIDDHKIRSVNGLFGLLADHYRVGQQITVHILRAGQVLDVPMTLSADVR